MIGPSTSELGMEQKLIAPLATENFGTKVDKSYDP